MQEVVYWVLCAVVERTPIGTNLGLVHLLWTLVSGQFFGVSWALGLP